MGMIKDARYPPCHELEIETNRLQEDDVVVGLDNGKVEVAAVVALVNVGSVMFRIVRLEIG